VQNDCSSFVLFDLLFARNFCHSNVFSACVSLPDTVSLYIDLNAP